MSEEPYWKLKKINIKQLYPCIHDPYKFLKYKKKDIEDSIKNRKRLLKRISINLWRLYEYEKSLNEKYGKDNYLSVFVKYQVNEVYSFLGKPLEDINFDELYCYFIRIKNLIHSIKDLTYSKLRLNMNNGGLEI